MKKTFYLSVLFIFVSIYANIGAYAADVTYKVMKGDNLYSIAKKNHVPVNTLKNINNLKSTKLRIGQTLLIRKMDNNAATIQDKTKNTYKATAGTKTPVIESAHSEEEADLDCIEYKVKKGDTLTRLARRFDVDPEDILTLNNMKKKRLAPGKIILIPQEPKEESEQEFVVLPGTSFKPWKDEDERFMLVKVAKSFVGAPYKYGGESVRGLDCSAFVKKIYQIFDVDLPRSAREQFKTGKKISKDELAVGDLVFFRTKRHIRYPTHVGIYIGDGNFIHSSSGRRRIGVKIDSLSSAFYSRTYTGAIRIKTSPEDMEDITSKSGNKSSNRS